MPSGGLGERRVLHAELRGPGTAIEPTDAKTPLTVLPSRPRPLDGLINARMRPPGCKTALTQCRQQALGSFHIGGVRAFDELLEHRLQEVARVFRPPLLGP
jgi:hypothetical protein